MLSPYGIVKHCPTAAALCVLLFEVFEHLARKESLFFLTSERCPTAAHLPGLPANQPKGQTQDSRPEEEGHHTQFGSDILYFKYLSIMTPFPILKFENQRLKGTVSRKSMI